jgi:hypothetical protein
MLTTKQIKALRWAVEEAAAANLWPAAQGTLVAIDKHLDRVAEAQEALRALVKDQRR